MSWWVNWNPDTEETNTPSSYFSTETWWLNPYHKILNYLFVSTDFEDQEFKNSFVTWSGLWALVRNSSRSARLQSPKGFTGPRGSDSHMWQPELWARRLGSSPCEPFPECACKLLTSSREAIQGGKIGAGMPFRNFPEKSSVITFPRLFVTTPSPSSALKRD